MDDLISTIGRAVSFVGRGLVRILVEEVFERFLIGTARVAVPVLTFGAVAVEGAAPRPRMLRCGGGARTTG